MIELKPLEKRFLENQQLGLASRVSLIPAVIAIHGRVFFLVLIHTVGAAVLLRNRYRNTIVRRGDPSPRAERHNSKGIFELGITCSKIWVT
jgi:hypothetical protein